MSIDSVNKGEQENALVDQLILAVCKCHNSDELRSHARGDVDTFRRAIRAVLE